MGHERVALKQIRNRVKQGTCCVTQGGGLQLCDSLAGWEGGREVHGGRDICLPVADSR